MLTETHNQDYAAGFADGYAQSRQEIIAFLEEEASKWLIATKSEPPGVRRDKWLCYVECSMGTARMIFKGDV